MATSIPEIESFLEEKEIKYKRKDPTTLIFGAATEHYTDQDGDKGLILVLKLEEDGEFFKLFCPNAFRITGPNVDAFLRLCTHIQWCTKMIQFEYDHHDGEVRPIIEFPLEDAPLTARQLYRCISGLVELVDRHFEILEKARITGKANLDEAESGREEQMLSALEELMKTLRKKVADKKKPKDGENDDDDDDDDDLLNGDDDDDDDDGSGGGGNQGPKRFRFPDRN